MGSRASRSYVIEPLVLLFYGLQIDVLRTRSMVGTRTAQGPPRPQAAPSRLPQAQTPGAGSTLGELHRIQLPLVGDTFEPVRPTVGERKPAPATRSLTVREHRSSPAPAWASTRAAICTAIPRCHPGAAHIPGMQADPDPQVMVGELGPDGGGRADGPGRPIEGLTDGCSTTDKVIA